MKYSQTIFQKLSLSKKLKFKYVSKDFLYRNSDIISIHVPLNAETKNMINMEVLINEKISILINTSRGQVVSEKDLIYALKITKSILAALDVFENEPIENKELVNLSNIICTPHIAEIQNRL